MEGEGEWRKDWSRGGDGGCNSGDGARGRAKWKDLGCVL